MNLYKSIKNKPSRSKYLDLNTVFPRKLWTMTINHVNRVVNGHVTVRTMKKITHDDLIIDPLQILR